mmetsp:Transcript_2090/g.4690  ORF Transcript_2090/g.4690 Transcript_2090/m.4690 type:complete len:245 (+) Transcript_2090:68-802(+)
MELSDAHKAQISRFTAFFKAKRERMLTDIEGAKNDFMTDRLVDESAIFNCRDVHLLLETYHAQVVASVKDESEKATNLSGVFVAQLLCQAEGAGMSLQVPDISVIEDQNRVGQIGSLAAVTAPPLAPKPRATLTAMEGISGVDPSVLQELQDARGEIQMIRDRNAQLQTEMSAVLKERSALASEVEQLRANPASSGVDSTHFRNLKSMLKKKTAENKDLKQRMVEAGLTLPDDGQGIDLVPDSD